jgi:hypothetical protein
MAVGGVVVALGHPLPGALVVIVAGLAILWLSFAFVRKLRGMTR